MGFVTPFAVRNEPASAYEFATGAQTTDATPLNVTLFTPSKSMCRQVKARISACKSDGSKGATWEIAAAVRCDSSGTLTLLGATTLAAEADASFAPTAEVNVSGANIVAIFTGVAATTINWNVDVEVA